MTKEYYEKNKEKINKQKLKRYYETRDVCRGRMKKYYQENKDILLPKYRLNSRSKYKELKDLVFAHYGKKCACCNESNEKFLSIDHKNNDGNKDKYKNGRRKAGVIVYRKIIADSFPNDIQILCMNCNFGKKVNGGICPHKDICQK